MSCCAETALTIVGIVLVIAAFARLRLRRSELIGMWESSDGKMLEFSQQSGDIRLTMGGKRPSVVSMVAPLRLIITPDGFGWVSPDGRTLTLMGDRWTRQGV